MILQILLWSAMIFSCAGYYFLNRKSVMGYKVFMIANICTIIFDLITHNWIQLIMFLVFVAFNIDGIIKWSKSEKQPEIINKIALADEYFDLIENGIKTSTIRYKRRDYKLDECEFYSDTSGKKIIVDIYQIEYRTMGSLSETDAIQDGFKSLEELKNALYRFYPNAKDEDEITKVIFRKKV